ncbi:MAG TPA: hypothetical protein VGP48_10700 [Stellaceae bacterium]|jgi:hypothetical protein|nr:hypothetical protein [Stellaceae bacterium]
MMQAKRRSYDSPVARSRVVEVSPFRYRGIAIVASCAVSWAVVFGAAKLLLAAL